MGFSLLIGSLRQRRTSVSSPVAPRAGHDSGQLELPRIEMLSDQELERLNTLLPWNSYIVDRRGRRFGNWHSPDKRSEPQRIPDPRIAELHRRVDLSDCHVLEVGCFEGIHTAALSSLARTVTAVDGRIENVAKTLVRCGLLGRPVQCFCWNVESDVPDIMPPDWDVLHHVGVLYHLADPVGHLERMLPRTRRAVLLDTHVAPDDELLSEASSKGWSYRYYRFPESSRDNPFAGLTDHARWLPLSDLQHVLTTHGFDQIDVSERRAERHGPRVCLYATRSSVT